MPKLRFPGFEGEWEWMPVSDLLTSMNDKPYQVRASEYHDYGLYDVVDQGKNDIVARSNLKSKLFTSVPIIVFGDHTTISKYRDTPFIVGGDGVKLLKSNNNTNNLKYLYYAILKYGPKAEGYKRHFPILKEKRLPIPVNGEQHKISTFLSLLDCRIAAQRKLVELLKKHKRGLLDRIFERSKQTEKWKKYRLDQIAKINPSSESLPCEFFYIDLESVSDGVWHNKKVVKKESAPSRAQRIIQKNDILFQMVRPYQQNNLHITSSYDKPIVASTGYAQIRTSQNPSFIYWLLHSRTFLRKVLLRCTGSSYPAINSSDLKEIYVSIPSLEDQDQYARALNSISQKCSIEESLVCHLENLKSGLLQQMFV